MLVLIVAGVGAFLYFPRGGASTSAQNAATLAILNTAIEGARAGAALAPALDGETYATGDLVRANVDGRAVLTFFDGSSLSVDPGSQVRVVALNRVSTDGIQVTIEQSLGRSWQSVQKLSSADPLPPGPIDAMKGLVDTSTADISGTVPFLVKQARSVTAASGSAE